MENKLNSEFITACPYCYANNPNAPHSFLSYDPNKPGMVICEKKHEVMPITDEIINAPKFHFSHYNNDYMDRYKTPNTAIFAV